MLHKKLKNLGDNYSAYIRVSPSGNKVAVDKSGTVVIFDVQTPGQELVYSLGGGFDAEWSDTARLAITGASDGVIVLDTNTGDKKIAIRNIGGLPGGVTFDHNQTLFDPDPDPDPDSWYFLNANRVTGEFYLKLYSENIKSVYVFQKKEID